MKNLHNLIAILNIGKTEFQDFLRIWKVYQIGQASYMARKLEINRLYFLKEKKKDCQTQDFMERLHNFEDSHQLWHTTQSCMLLELTTSMTPRKYK